MGNAKSAPLEQIPLVDMLVYHTEPPHVLLPNLTEVLVALILILQALQDDYFSCQCMKKIRFARGEEVWFSAKSVG